jgi:hypothetical protein
MNEQKKTLLDRLREIANELDDTKAGDEINEIVDKLEDETAETESGSNPGGPPPPPPPPPGGGG